MDKIRFILWAQTDDTQSECYSIDYVLKWVWEEKVLSKEKTEEKKDKKKKTLFTETSLGHISLHGDYIEEQAACSFASS